MVRTLPRHTEEVFFLMSQFSSAPTKLGPLGWLTIAVLLLILIAAVWFAHYAWNMFPGTEIGTDGTIAMVLGIVFSALVGGGLMGLLFWSSRKGFDR
jgi:uncharacterized membrane protein YphA (DoxX/SURF4 family)